MRTTTLTISSIALLLGACSDQPTKISPEESTGLVEEDTIVQTETSPYTLTDQIEGLWKDDDETGTRELIRTYLGSVTVNEAYEWVDIKWSGPIEQRDRAFSRILAEELAASSEDSRAIYRAGLAYYLGIGADRDYSKALEYFSHPTQAGNHAVTYYRADMLLDDSSPVYAPEEGAELLRRAADNGVQEAVERVSAQE